MLVFGVMLRKPDRIRVGWSVYCGKGPDRRGQHGENKPPNGAMIEAHAQKLSASELSSKGELGNEASLIALFSPFATIFIKTELKWLLRLLAVAAPIVLWGWWLMRRAGAAIFRFRKRAGSNSCQQQI